MSKQGQQLPPAQGDGREAPGSTGPHDVRQPEGPMAVGQSSAPAPGGKKRG